MSTVTRGLYVLGGDLPATAPDPLAEMVGRDAEARLDEVLDRIGERLAREEDEREADGTPLDPVLVARLEEVCARPGAVVELGSLQRHVSDGLLTWEDVWAAPEDHAGGVRLVCEVLALAASDSPEIEAG